MDSLLDTRVLINAAISNACNRLLREQKNCSPEQYVLIGILIHKLRGIRTFVLCSRKLGDQLLIVDSNVYKSARSNIVKTFFLCSTKLDHDKVNHRQCLLSRIRHLARRIWHEDIFSDNIFATYLVNIESFEEEMDKWYSIALSYEQTPVIRLVERMFDSVVENLNDVSSFLISASVGYVVEPIEALKECITVLRQFIRFATLLETDNELHFKDFLTQVEPLAISAAHLTLHLFSSSHYNSEVFSSNVGNSRNNLSYQRAVSKIPALLLKIKPANNILLHETSSRTLVGLRYQSTLHFASSYLKEFIDFLLSTLLEMLHFSTGSVTALKDKLQALYEGLRSLRILVKKMRNKFDKELVDFTGFATFNAGCLIFSLPRKDFVIDCELQDFLDDVKIIQTKVEREREVVKATKCRSPQTNMLGFLDSLFEYLTEVKHSKVESDTLSCVPKIRDDIVFLRSYLGSFVGRRNEAADRLPALFNIAKEVAYKIEFVIDQLVLGDILYSFSALLASITEDIRTIKSDSIPVCYNRSEEMEVLGAPWTTTDEVSSQSSILAADEIVGFGNEKLSIINRLTRGSKSLQVVAIVGMPGLGKTTLATIVYNDLSASLHFHVRTRCSISPMLNKRKVLVELLIHIQTKPASEYVAKTEDDMAEELWRSLKGRRYLIFLDDIWDVQAFDCLKELFPDDYTGSRILLTSRHGDVATLDENPLFLPQLTPRESLELLQMKLFRSGWPPSLVEVVIAKYCKGLPLTIIIVAGILKTTDPHVWNDVVESLRSGTISATDHCINTIELSYKHLPEYLKPCFLSFAAFSEGYVLSVKRLIWQWIAEGLVQKSESRSLEQVAENYLNSLIGRSLVMNVKRRSGGGVKTCRVHDLLHDFCLRKANEENFLHLVKGRELLYFEKPGNLRRLCLYSKPEDLKESKLFCPGLRSLLLFHPTEWNEEVDMSFICLISKLLRVLDIERVNLTVFPSEIGLLAQLRYLAINGTSNVSPSIGNLSNLETFIIRGRLSSVMLPSTFWNLRKLRHLYTCGHIEISMDNLQSSCDLLELNTLSTLKSNNWDIMEKHLRKFPNIHQLKCWLPRYKANGSTGCEIVDFSFLSQVESLKVSSTMNVTELNFIFPENMKKLTLHYCNLSAQCFSRIAELPDLEVLKLDHSDIGDAWHVEEGEFSKLKFLKFKSLDIVKWTADSEDQFSNLEKLVLEDCHNLEEIPECLENVATLGMVEVINCSDYVAGLMKKVEEYQKDMGNSVLQLHVRSTLERH